MEDLNTKRKNIGDDERREEGEKSSWAKKPTLVKPLPQRAQPNLPFGSGSSFQPWKRPFEGIKIGDHGIINNGGAALTRSNNATKPLHRLATCSNSNTMHKENLIIENNHVNNEVIGANSDGDHANDDHISDDDEVPEEKHSSGSNTKQEIDPKKLKRMMSNRISAQRSRERRDAYVAELEAKVQAYQEKIELIFPKIEVQKTIVHSLKIEQHKLKLLMANREKQRVLQEVAIEKNRAEVERLREVNMKLAAEAQAKMLNMTAALHLNSSINNTDLNGEGTSSTAQVDNTAEQSQNHQNQLMMMMATTTRDNNTTRSIIPNLNLAVNSEPES